MKLALSQIVKNESHVITRMLDSIKPIVDVLVIVDTGSTDNTEEIIRKWAEENGKECHIYNRPFDNFENSRNYAMEMAKDKADYAFWLDADEIMHLDLTLFDKNKLDKDIYMFTTNIGTMRYTRNECWKTSKPFRWYGPIHEFIVSDDPNITSDLMPGVSIEVRLDGGSWKSNVAEKYFKHSQVFEDYITKDFNPRWIFYTAQSYHDSAQLQNNKRGNEERLRRALYYYKNRVSILDGYPEERFYSQFRIGTIMEMLECPWAETQQELLKAYAIDPLRAEPFVAIIDHYMNIGEWDLAYYYSTAAKTIHHGNNPFPHRVLFLDEQIYEWKLLYFHSICAYYTNRKEESKHNYKLLLKIVSEKPSMFNEQDLARIEYNKSFMLA